MPPFHYTNKYQVPWWLTKNNEFSSKLHNWHFKVTQGGSTLFLSTVIVHKYFKPIVASCQNFEIFIILIIASLYLEILICSQNCELISHNCDFFSELRVYIAQLWLYKMQLRIIKSEVCDINWQSWDHISPPLKIGLYNSQLCVYLTILRKKSQLRYKITIAKIMSELWLFNLTILTLFLRIVFISRIYDETKCHNCEIMSHNCEEKKNCEVKSHNYLFIFLFNGRMGFHIF